MAEPTRGSVTISAAPIAQLLLAEVGSVYGRFLFTFVLIVEVAVLSTAHLLPVDLDWWWTAPISLGTYAFVIAMIVYVRAVRNPPPQLDFERSELRVGSDVTRFADIDTAVVPTEPVGPTTHLALDLAAADHRKVRFILRSASKRELTTPEREAVAAMIALSGIRVPDATPDPYDPTGRFSWMAHPNHRSKEAAIELVLHTPEEGAGERTGKPAGG